MPPEGLEWLPNPACCPTMRWCGWPGSGSSSWASTRSGSPGASRCCAGACPASSPATAELRPRPEISLTTNGIGLTRLADPLRAAGLDRINVSLDTLNPETFRQLSRRDRLDDVLAGLAAARRPACGRSRSTRC